MGDVHMVVRSMDNVMEIHAFVMMVTLERIVQYLMSRLHPLEGMLTYS